MDVACSNCGAAFVAADQAMTTKCPYCASPQVVSRPPSRDRPTPTFTIPFAMAQEPARERVRGWLKTRGFFRDPKLKGAAITEMRGVYVPAYLYAAAAHTAYSAEIGEDYQETETYTETDDKGNTVTKTRTVTRTEWRALAGAHAQYVMDVLVTASRGLPNAELEAIEPFDLRQMRRYDEALVVGWIAEEPTVSLQECMQTARQEAVEKIGRAIATFMPGDHQRGLTYQTTLENETADAMHVPVWVVAARPDPEKPAVRIVVNGQSGAVWGHAPLSVLRIVIVVAIVVLAITAAVMVIKYGGIS